MSRIAALYAVLSISPILGLAGQNHSGIAPGDRVRVTRHGTGSPLVGTVLALEGDSLRLKLGGQAAVISIPESAITTVEVRRWHDSYAGSGAATGSLVGAVFGATFGSRIPTRCSGFLPDLCSDTHRFALAVVGGVVGVSVGAVVGAVIGSAVHKNTWERVSLNHARVSLGSRGAGLALSVRF